MQRKNIGCGTSFLIIFMVFVLMIGFVLWKTSGYIKNSSNKKTEIVPIFNASLYSDMTSKKLVNTLGEPQTKDSWNNKTNNGTFKLKTYTYQLDGMYIEFILHKNKVVKLHIFADDTWTLPDNRKDIFSLFGVTPGNILKKYADTGYALRYKLVSDEVDTFDIFDINSSDNTFAMVYITFDSSCFE